MMIMVPVTLRYQVLTVHQVSETSHLPRNTDCTVLPGVRFSPGTRESITDERCAMDRWALRLTQAWGWGRWGPGPPAGVEVGSGAEGLTWGKVQSEGG